MITYYDDGTIKIRSMVLGDAKVLYDTYLSYGWHPSLETYEKYYNEQEELTVFFDVHNKGIGSKLIVLGCSGSGKSTFAVQLLNKTKLN